jgi:purine-binding chemotaxis protein CheW
MKKKLSFRKMLGETDKKTGPKKAKKSRKTEGKSALSIPKGVKKAKKQQKAKKPEAKKKQQKKELLPPRPKQPVKAEKELDTARTKKKPEQKKIVLFRLSNEYYGIDVAKIDEIIDGHINEKIAGMPDFVAGVVSLRGESIPVLSLNERFHLNPSTEEETNTVLITSRNGDVYGICIDELQGVIDIDASTILSVPPIFPEDELAYLEGIIKYGMEIAALIDIDRVLNNYRLV